MAKRKGTILGIQILGVGINVDAEIPESAAEGATTVADGAKAGIRKFGAGVRSKTHEAASALADKTAGEQDSDEESESTEHGYDAT